MTKICFIVFTATFLVATTGKVQAQNWRDKNEGLAPTFVAKNVYGTGSSILATNSVLGFSNHLFHRPDTTTAFLPTATTFGGYAAVQSQIVAAKGALFAGTTDGLYRSTDNGVTWARSSAATGYIYSLYAINDTLYGGVGTGLGVAKMSTDTGQTWVSIGYAGFMTTAYVKANGVLYVGSNNGLQYTADNGATWTTPPFSSGLSGPIITGLAALGNSVYAACSTGVYKTIDNGATWAVVLPKSMFSLTTIDTSLLGGTNNSGIYQSDQFGTNWNTINAGLPFVGAASYSAVNCISYNNEVVIASLQGDSAIYVTGLASIGLYPSAPSMVNEATSSIECVSIYPNPASDVITIDVHSDSKAPITINVSDVTSRCIYSTSSTRGQTQVNLSTLAPGCYLISVCQGNNKTTRKVTITR